MTDDQYNGLVGAIAASVSSMNQDAVFMAHWMMGMCIFLSALVFFGAVRLYRI